LGCQSFTPAGLLGGDPFEMPQHRGIERIGLVNVGEVARAG
jgi:hypothetical protein